MSEPELPRPGAPSLWHWGDDAAKLDNLWAAGGIVAVPTESTYGLAVDPENAAAVDAVFRLKGRSATQPLPVIAGSVEDLVRLGARMDLPELAPVLAAWPAALTAIVPLARPLPAAGGGDTLAVRIPDHDRLRSLLLHLGRAVTATSANRSGSAPATAPEAVSDLLAGERAAVIYQADLPGGPPSTIVGVRAGRLAVIREGRFPASELARR